MSWFGLKMARKVQIHLRILPNTFLRFVMLIEKLRLSGIPVVRFACGITMAVKYIRWNVRVPGQETLIRYQLPLKLAWAISVHKAQVC